MVKNYVVYVYRNLSMEQINVCPMGMRGFGMASKYLTS